MRTLGIGLIGVGLLVGIIAICVRADERRFAAFNARVQNLERVTVLQSLQIEALNVRLDRSAR